LYANWGTLRRTRKITLDSNSAMPFTYVVHNAHAWVMLKKQFTYLII